MPHPNNQPIWIAGVGMVPFTKPGMGDSYDEMAKKAVSAALDDASLEYQHIQQAYAGYVYGGFDQRTKALYGLGLTGIPIINVNNNCSTGSTALYLARQAIEHGVADCVLAVGFEQMKPGAPGTVYEDRPSPPGEFDAQCDALVGNGEVPLALRYFGGAGLAHMEKYGTTLEDFAHVRAKASHHAVNNPLAVFRKPISSEEVMQSAAIWPGAMHRLMACPPTCGAAAAIVATPEFMTKHNLSGQVSIRAQVMHTDFSTTFDSEDMLRVVGYDMTSAAAAGVYEAAGIGPEDVDVVELHDCFAQNELITYEGLGLCAEGEAQKFIADGDNTYGGKFVTNPSGGLLSKGHPLGATGLAQCYELTQQLRGNAGARQVNNARIALQHNLGLGGACVATLYQRA